MIDYGYTPGDARGAVESYKDLVEKSKRLGSFAYYIAQEIADAEGVKWEPIA